MGPEQEFERKIKLANEIKAERFTSLDRGILRDQRECGGRVGHAADGAVAVLARPAARPPIRTPLLLAAQGPKGRAVAKEIADGLVALGNPVQGFDPCLVSVNGTVPARRRKARAVRAAVAPRLGTIYHDTLARDPEVVRRLPNGQAWLDSVMKVPEQMTFTGTPEALRSRLAKLEAAGATGVIFGTSAVPTSSASCTPSPVSLTCALGEADTW